MSFTKKLNEMVSFLESHDEIHINHFCILKAMPERINQVEKELGYSLHESIRDFYSECGGVQLIWTHRENPNFDNLVFTNHNQPLDLDWGNDEDLQGHDGVIMIPSLFSEESEWVKAMYIPDGVIIEFAGKEYNEPDFSTRLRPFDLFSRFNDLMFFLDGSTNPPLVMGDDYQANYTDSRPIHLEAYLAFLIYSKGSIAARTTLLAKHDGHQAPMVTVDEINKLPAIDFSHYNDGLVMPFENNYWNKK